MKKKPEPKLHSLWNNEERNWSDDWKEYMRERIKKIFPNEDLVKREDLQFLIKMAKCGCEMNFDWDNHEYKKFRRIKEENKIE